MNQTKSAYIKMSAAKSRKIDVSEETLDNLIKAELSKGHNIQEIKTDLIGQGFDERIVGKFTNKYFIRNYLIQAMFVLIILAIPLILFNNSSVTGFASFGQIQNSKFNSSLTFYPFIAVSMLIVLFIYMKYKKR